MTPPAAWIAQGTGWAACKRCDLGSNGACKRLEVSGVARSTEFDRARALGGACGPDARYLTIKGFDYSKECAV